MSKLVTFFIQNCLFFFSTGCHTSTVSKDNVIKLSYATTFPVIAPDGEVVVLKDTAFLFYYKEYYLYKLPYGIDSVGEVNVKDNGGNNDTVFYEIEQLPTGNTGYTYFAGSIKKKYGILMNMLSLDEIIGKRLLDSIHIERGMGTVDISGILDSCFLIDSLYDGSLDRIKMTYFPYKKGNDGDTVIVCMSNILKPYEIAISEKFDATHSMKLEEFRVIYNSSFSVIHNTVLPARELVIGIQRLSLIKEDAGIENFLKQLEKSGIVN